HDEADPGSLESAHPATDAMSDGSQHSPPSGVEPIPRLLRLPAVLQATGLARSTVYRMVAEHTFPAPVKLGRRAVAWRHDDVRQWAIGRPAASH
ncbi:MAG: helix-turn-helix transcriptional regulator, partial [Pseudomonadota bacterium]